MNIGFLLFIRPNQDVDLGHNHVLELLHSLFDLVLVGLDIHKEHSVLLSSKFSMADPVVGEFDGGTVGKPRKIWEYIIPYTKKLVLVTIGSCCSRLPCIRLYGPSLLLCGIHMQWTDGCRGSAS